MYYMLTCCSPNYSLTIDCINAVTYPFIRVSKIQEALKGLYTLLYSSNFLTKVKVITGVHSLAICPVMFFLVLYRWSLDMIMSTMMVSW